MDSGSIEWAKLQRLTNLEDRVLQLELQLSVTQAKLDGILTTGITSITIEFDEDTDKVRLFPQGDEVSGKGYASGNSVPEEPSDDDWLERLAGLETAPERSDNGELAEPEYDPYADPFHGERNDFDNPEPFDQGEGI